MGMANCRCMTPPAPEVKTSVIKSYIAVLSYGTLLLYGSSWTHDTIRVVLNAAAAWHASNG